MSNQEPHNPNKTTEDAAVEKRRRFIKGAGVAAPVILTLSSPSVFGNTLCGSELISGNVSNVGAGSCTTGLSPATWRTTATWPHPYLNNNSSGTVCTTTGGTAFNTAFPVAGITGVDSNTIDQILCLYANNNTSYQLKAYLIAALLNATNATTYPLQVADVQAIQAGTQAVPGYTTIPATSTQVEAYLPTTWV
jgi:hypothetical protein